MASALKVSDVISCLKLLLQTQDVDTKDSENVNESVAICPDGTTPVTKCSCHGTLQSNVTLNSIMRTKIRLFFSKTKKNDISSAVLSEGSCFTPSTDCECFGSGNDFFQDGCRSDAVWSFVVVCLKVLLLLLRFIQQQEVVQARQQQQQQQQQQLTQEQQQRQQRDQLLHTPNIIGVQDEESICSAMEVIISLGVYPELFPGVGRRLKSKTSTFQSLLADKSTLNPRKLYVVTIVLLKLLRNKTLSSIMVAHNLNDIIASLVQLCHCPPKYCNQTGSFVSQCCCMTGVKFKVCVNCSSLCPHERKVCIRELNEVVSTIYQPFIIKELLILQQCCIVAKRPNTKWFLRVIGNKLSACVVRNNGVKYVIEGILAGCNSDTMNWQKYKSIGNLLSRVPAQVTIPEDYFKLVCPQLLQFLAKGDSTPSSHYVMVSVACIEDMLLSNRAMCEEYVLAPMLKCLHSCFSRDGLLRLHSEEMTKCLTSLSMLCTVAVGLSDILIKKLSEVLHVLFIVLCLHEDITARKSLQAILAYLLHHTTAEESVQWFHIFTFDKLALNKSLQQVDSEARFISGKCDQDGFVTLENVSTEVKVTTLLSILKYTQLEKVRGNFFVSLLGQLASLLQNENLQKERKCDKNDGTTSPELLEIDIRISDIQHKIQLVSMISALTDTYGCEILQSTPQTVAFIKSILDLPWRTKEKDSISLDVDEDFHEETVDLVLMLISFLLKTDKLSSADFQILYTLIPSLEKASHNHSNESTRALAIDLKVYIATKGAVTSEGPCSKAQVDPRTVDYSSKEAYDIALKELNDPLLPTRGHALFQLSKLLKNRNKYAIEDQKKLMDIFEANLAHHDTYLYLAAIEGLLFLVDVHHKEVMPLLCRKFALFRDEGSSAELRMKLGEAIVKSCRLIGALLPMYCPLLLSALLTGVKDPDNLVRASSLSAIGDVCQLSKFSISSISVEIVSCIRHVVVTDTSVEVRRAAVQVFTLMFKGAGESMLREDPETIKDIYRILKNVLCAEKDELTQLHVSSALEILDDVVKDALFASPKMEKKIQILGYSV